MTRVCARYASRLMPLPAVVSFPQVRLGALEALGALANSDGRIVGMVAAGVHEVRTDRMIYKLLDQWL